MTMMYFAAASDSSSAGNLGLSGRGSDAPRHYSEVGLMLLMLVIWVMLLMLVPLVMLMLVLLVILMRHNIYQRWMMNKQWQ